MRLFAPGMSALHRAGLGGLACTLRAMERAYAAGVLEEEQLPEPFSNGRGPWDITDDQVVLKFGTPETAKEYLKRLFEFAFQIRDGLIYLPGQYTDPPPSLAVRAELQTALSRTLLQATKKNVRYDPSTPYFIDPDGSGVGTIQIAYQRCLGFDHQKEWNTFVEKRTGRLLDEPKGTTVSGYLPGAIVRHSAPGFGSVSSFEESVERLLCAVFGFVGCLALNLPGPQGLLLIPEAANLTEFCFDRPLLTPGTVAEIKVGGAGDAVLQAQLRLRARSSLTETSIPACTALRFDNRTWTKPQKARVFALAPEGLEAARIEPVCLTVGERSLRRFEVAMAELPSRVRLKEEKPDVGGRAERATSGTKDKSAGKKTFKSVPPAKPFWAESVVRPLIADNLATGRRWYDRFDCLVRDRGIRRRMNYETRGLRAMATNSTLTDKDEARYIAAVHRAVFMGRGRIYADTMGADAARRVQANTATKKRWERFMERLRLGLVGSKTASQFQEEINKLLARHGTVKELRDREAVQLIRQIVFGTDWQRARNLALFALASYQRPVDTQAIPGDAESEAPATTQPEAIQP